MCLYLIYYFDVCIHSHCILIFNFSYEDCEVTHDQEDVVDTITKTCNKTLNGIVTCIL